MEFTQQALALHHQSDPTGSFRSPPEGAGREQGPEIHFKGKGVGLWGGKSVGRAGEGFKHETGSVPHFEAQAGAEKMRRSDRRRSRTDS